MDEVKMTFEEALKYVPRVAKHYGTEDMPRYTYASNKWFKTVKEALEKQIPKKCEDLITTDDEYVGSICKCGYFIGLTRNYCPNCGQRLE